MIFCSVSRTTVRQKAKADGKRTVDIWAKTDGKSVIQTQKNQQLSYWFS
jgi:hypothetical protein